MTGLFRHEVAEARRDSHFGDVVVATPVSFVVMAVVVLISMVGMALYLAYGHYDRKQTVHGFLTPSKGLVKVYTPKRGVVMERRVAPGDQVRKGEVLFIVSTTRSTIGVTNIQASLRAQAAATRKMLRNQIMSATALKTSTLKKLKGQVDAFRQEQVAMRKRIGIEQQRLKLAQRHLARLKPLREAGRISASDYQQQHSRVLAQRATIQLLARDAVDLRRKIQSAKSDRVAARLNAASQIAEYRKAISRLDTQSLQYRAAGHIVIHAPVTGTVGSVVVRPGQQVEPQRPLATVLPSGSELTVRLLVPTRAIGFIRCGEQVRVRFAAFPYQQFGLYGAQVINVSRTIFPPEDLATPVATREPVYLVTASLDDQSIRAYGKTMPLQAGMLVSAEIIVQRETLMHWVLSPLYGLRGSI